MIIYDKEEESLVQKITRESLLNSAIHFQKDYFLKTFNSESQFIEITTIVFI